MRGRTIPPRPDLGLLAPPEGRRRPTALMVALALAVASASAVGASLAIAERSVLRRAAPPTSPAASPSQVASSEPAFRFLDHVAYGEPRRWDSCDGLTYRINVSGAPRGGVEDVTEAVRRASDATGIEFEESATTRRDAFQQAVETWYGQTTTRVDIEFVWVDHQDFLKILRRFGVHRHAIAIGVPFEGVDEWVGGLIVLDVDVRLPRGFGSAHSHGLVLMHELGHVLGLGHVKDPSEVMFSGRAPDVRVNDWGRGDLEGLRLLGTEAACSP